MLVRTAVTTPSSLFCLYLNLILSITAIPIVCSPFLLQMIQIRGPNIFIITYPHEGRVAAQPVPEADAHQPPLQIQEHRQQ